MASDLEAAKTAIDNFTDGIAAFEDLMAGEEAHTSKTGAANGTFSSTAADGESVDIYIISFDAGTLADSSNYIVSGLITGTAKDRDPAQTPIDSTFFASSSWSEVGAGGGDDPGPGPGPGPEPIVPEPSVAVLGMIGAGLLFKRRK